MGNVQYDTGRKELGVVFHDDYTRVYALGWDLKGGSYVYKFGIAVP